MNRKEEIRSYVLILLLVLAFLCGFLLGELAGKFEAKESDSSSYSEKYFCAVTDYMEVGVCEAKTSKESFKYPTQNG